MSLADIADVIGIVRDFLLIFALLAAILILLVLYKKLASLLDSAGRAMRNAEEVATSISSRIVRPATAGSGMASGIGKLVAFITGFSRRSTSKGG